MSFWYLQELYILGKLIISRQNPLSYYHIFLLLLFFNMPPQLFSIINDGKLCSDQDQGLQSL